MSIRIGVREKLFGVSLLLIVVVTVAAGFYLENRLRHWIEFRIETELMRHTLTAQTLISHTAWPLDAQSAKILADRLAADTATRITIIDQDGRVLGDSEVPLDHLSSVENHGHRPEVRNALTQGIGKDRRHSATIDSDLLYIALPVGSPTIGVVRAATPLADVDRAVRELRLNLLAAGIIAMALAVSMSGFASHLFTRPLRTLLQQLRALSHRHGNSAAPGSKDELEHILGSFHQLTQALEQQMFDLAEERNLSAAILDCMSEALFALNERQEVVLVNRAALQLLGLGQIPFNLPLAAVIGLPELSQVITSSHAGEVVSIEFELNTSGRSRHILARAAPQRVGGGNVVVLYDITEMRRMEKFLRDFVANASHELRTPVSVIRANAETLIDGALENPRIARRLVEALYRNAERLARLVADLLDLSRLDARQVPINLIPINLTAAIDRTLESLGDAAQSKHIGIELDLQPQLQLYADEKALDQILFNLMDNAIKFTPSGGLIRVRGRTADDKVRIEIEDTGPGVPAEHRDRIFERFYRVDAGRSRELGGTGLGLAIVKTLMAAMGGTVGVEPAQVTGSIFWVSLPAAAPDSA